MSIIFRDRSLDDFKDSNLLLLMKLDTVGKNEAISIVLAYPEIHEIDENGNGEGATLIKHNDKYLMLFYTIEGYQELKIRRILELEPFFDDDIEMSWGCLFSFWLIFGDLIHLFKDYLEINPRDSQWYKPILIGKHECSEEEWKVLTRDSNYENDWIEIPSFTKRYQLANEIEKRNLLTKSNYTTN